MRRPWSLFALVVLLLAAALGPPLRSEAQAQRSGSLLVRDGYDRLLNLYVDPLTPGTLLTEAWGALSGAALAAGVERLPVLPPLPADRREAWTLFAAGYADLEGRIAGRISSSALAHLAINAMAEARNECHTYFMNPTQYTAFRAQLDGQQRFVGVGISLSATAPFTILRVVPESPAERAGLRAGDVIVAVDGVPAAEHTLSGLRARIAGEAGTSVDFTISRVGDDGPVTITVTRGEVRIAAVTSTLRPDGIGVVTVNTFAVDGTTERLTRSALVDLEARGATGWVLDLRNNPGGSVSSVLRVLGLFLPVETVAITTIQRDRAPLETAPIGPALAVQRPLAVLAGGQSASGAEITAAVLQDAGRARLFGQRTFGCANVGTLTELGDGSALVITSSRLLAGPHKRQVDGPGVEPDEMISNIAPGDPALEAAVRYLLALTPAAGQPATPQP